MSDYDRPDDTIDTFYMVHRDGSLLDFLVELEQRIEALEAGS